MITTSISYTTTFPNIPWDLGQQLTETNPSALVLSGQYENYDWGFNVTFGVQDPGEGGTPNNIVSVAVTLPVNTTDSIYTPEGEISYETSEFSSPITYNIGSIVNNTITVAFSGKYSGIFNEIFQFVMRDGSVRNLPINNREDWVAVTKWAPPSSKEKLISYAFEVVTEDPISEIQSTFSVSIPQYVYWGWQPSLAAFSKFVAEGEL